MNTCAKCEMKFRHWADYNAHLISRVCMAKIVPMNTSGRSKSEIVMAWEYRNHAHLIY